MPTRAIRSAPLHRDLLRHHRPEQERLILSLVHLLHGLGFRNVRACTGEQAPPPLLGPADGVASVRPDVLARSSSGHLDAFAVETPAALATRQAAEKWRALAAAAETSGVRFWVAVRNEDRDEARRRLYELGLQARVLGIWTA